jgi:type II secretory pathway pseudopilin PulG
MTAIPTPPDPSGFAKHRFAVPRPARRRGRHLFSGLMRGFTLTELMVAMSGGLVISIAVFLLARQASRFYSREARTSTATLSNLVGFERLRVDIARAGFMASPNIREDLAPCNNPKETPDGWPEYLAHLQSVWIQPIGGDLPAQFRQQGRNPMRIMLAGNYASADQFEVRNIAHVDENYTVYLAVNSTSMHRLTHGDAGTSVSTQVLASIFGAGRAVRIVDPEGRHHYGRILNVIGGEQPRVTLSEDPELRERSIGNRECGLIGVDTGSLINVVNIVHYDIRSLANDDNYRDLYTSNLPYEAATHRDLVREELDVEGDPIDGTQELVAEYAVDLSFQLTGWSPSTQTLETVPLAGWADSTSSYNAPLAGPQRLRAIRATLAVRSREADRDIAVLGDGGGAYLRFGVGSTPGTGPFARVRAISAHIALNNQLGVMW